jgi:TM2 domain-containing membrane protein YozV
MKKKLFLICTLCLYLNNTAILYAEKKTSKNEDSIILELAYIQKQLSLEYFANHPEDINMEKSSITTLGLKDKKREGISYKSPWLALVLSYLCPGAGQLYNGEYLKAILFPAFFCVGAGLIIMSSPGADFESQKPGPTLYPGIILAGGSYLWSLIDAPISASRINEENKLSGLRIFSSEGEKYVLKINSDLIIGDPILQLSFNF